MNRLAWISLCLLSCVLLSYSVAAKNRSKAEDSTTAYIHRVQNTSVQATATVSKGSLWRDEGELANLTSDNKARSVGDTVVISIVEQTLAQASGTVTTQRTFTTNSGISALAGRISTAGVNPTAIANSDTQLKGQGQTASTSSLRTSLAGQVVAVLRNGNLVIEAHRNVLMNNERQTVFLRGVARPGDLSGNNVVLSTQLSNLEVELRGKGVISNGTRQPNPIVRALLRILSF